MFTEVLKENGENRQGQRGTVMDERTKVAIQAVREWKGPFPRCAIHHENGADEFNAPLFLANRLTAQSAALSKAREAIVIGQEFSSQVVRSRKVSIGSIDNVYAAQFRVKSADSKHKKLSEALAAIDKAGEGR